MSKLERISIWDLPDTKREPDGWNTKEVADISARNIDFLIDKHNELVDVVNQILETKVLTVRK